MKHVCFLKKSLLGMPAHTAIYVSDKRNEYYGVSREFFQFINGSVAVKKSDLIEFNHRDVEDAQEVFLMLPCP